MKNPHNTSSFRHIQCEWSVSCTWDRTYRDTTPLNLLPKSARTAHSVLNACCTVFILTNMISKQVYTQVCASMSNTSSSPPSAALGPSDHSALLSWSISGRAKKLSYISSLASFMLPTASPLLPPFIACNPIQYVGPPTEKRTV